MGVDESSVAGDPGGLLEVVGRQWALCLSEPLLSLDVRLRYENEFIAACVNEPDWVAMFLAGVVSDMMLTLPSGDPWRDLSARAAGLCRGKRPPAVTGAVCGNGSRFGKFQHAEDVIVAFGVMGPALDVDLCALLPPLSKEGAAILAFGADGWEACRDAITAIHADVVSRSTSGSGEAAREAGTDIYAAGTAAARWAVHRRRAYFEIVDSWPADSGAAWAWRADQMTQGRSWPRDAVDAGLAFENVKERAIAAGQVLKVDFPDFGNELFGRACDDPDDF